LKLRKKNEKHRRTTGHLEAKKTGKELGLLGIFKGGKEPGQVQFQGENSLGILTQKKKKGTTDGQGDVTEGRPGNDSPVKAHPDKKTKKKENRESVRADDKGRARRVLLGGDEKTRPEIRSWPLKKNPSNPLYQSGRGSA